MSLWRVYLRVLQLLAPEKRLAVTLVLANLALSGVAFLEPVLFGKVIDALAAQGKGRSAWHYIAMWAGVGFGGIAAGVFVSLFADRLAHRRRLAVIAQYFEHAIALPLSYHGQHHTGRLLRIMHTGSNNLFGLWLGFFRDHLTTLLSILLMIPWSLYVNWKLGLLMVGLMVTFATFNAIAMRRTHRAQGQIEQLHSAISERAGDVLGNVPVVQVYTRLQAEVEAIREMSRRALDAQYPVLRGWAWLSVANRAASTLTIVAIFALGAQLNAKGEVTVGGIVTFVNFALLQIGRLEAFAGFISNLFFQTPSLSDFFAVLDTDATVKEDPKAPPLPDKVRGQVRFEDVSFGYDASHPALRALNFTAAAGSTVALVGPTGAGKSTALSLLYRAYDPDRGRITIDGIDIRTVKLTSLREHIAVVFQDPGLLYRSVADNLRVGKPDASALEMEEAARAAEAHNFVVVKPEGYSTLVAERGVSLSGGERQRLSIARAMLKNAPILILDEATSALDNATEARIQRALNRLTRDRTTFVIAHRLSTVRNADLILVMKDGEIVEQGRFDALVAQGGLFAQLEAGGQFVADAEEEVVAVAE
ncbi:glucan ABC transporter ATP-binding protein/ permease [Pseudoxanthomonas winnipegensis]|uniref:Glucan ABC transporter ATP-binding protein/ permease n=1 Tax=Pseudoxanthomonas winnipegensis TaxID=2480810 RepID=A0A4Q8M6M9_9GAMM|nr:glucan ABC transporter ATP-binding protein/ permease [Pseudoxanthomonas winnipegensis]TAA44870.1 glucan ABC transporter ATP-binding protein/ permease [Pseudoxanthomonas winnipegensis]